MLLGRHMTHRKHTVIALLCASLGFFLLAAPARLSADDAKVKEDVESLRQENSELKKLIRQQGAVIEKLNERVDNLEKKSSADGSSDAAKPGDAGTKSGFSLGRVRISGEGGVGLFDSQANGMFPNSEFRVDEAKLFVETPLWNEVYFFSELNLASRHYDELDMEVGELYVDFENVSQLWGCDGQMSIRVGRLDIPFGEEYLSRDAIDNPLISHSLADLWGVDEGIEFYGAFGPVSYVLAVQNGGVPVARDFNSDKSVALRIAVDPTPWLHLSISGMRTGDLDAEDDYASELWIGGGWFRSIGSVATREFHAELAQGDVAVKFSRGHVKAFGGYARYDDNDPLADNQRDFFYYSVEAMCDVTKKLYAAARFSQIFADDGYPLPGNGDLGYYYFFPAPPAEDLWRLSLGLGWRFSENLILKTEYSFEGGQESGDNDRDKVNFFGAEAAFKF